MFKPENNLSIFKRVLLSRTLLVSFIISIPVTIGLGYIIKTHKEIEEYKQLTLWYENLDDNLDEETRYAEVFSEFVEKAQNKLMEDYNKSFKNPENVQILDKDIEEKIILPIEKIDNAKEAIPWKIEKNGYFTNAFYDYTQIIDFKTLPSSSEIDQEQKNNREKEKIQSEKDKIFQNFTYLMRTKIKPYVKQDNNDNGINNLRNFSEVVIDYLAKDKGYSSLMQDLKINNIYILNVRTGFFISYPANDQGYPDKIDFETRPWFRATKNEYPSSFSETDTSKNNSGLTGVYIDIIDGNKFNAIRTLWYKFKDTKSDKEYILCFDLFLDKSGQISSKNNLKDLQQMLLSEGAWKSLFFLNLLLALCLSLIYEWVIKNIFRRISKSHGNDFSIIKIKREKKHYASQDENEIRFTIVGETKDINQSEHSREAGWSFNIQNIKAGISNSQSRARQQEATSRYEFTNTYNLNMRQNKPQYRCIETWKVVSESPSGKTQNIGFFVAKWNTNNGVDLEDGLDIQSIYWEKGYEEYLDTFKEQLCNHLLVSDAQELVAILDRNYSKQQNIPNVISGINSLEKIIKISRDLKQGKIVFSDFETLTDLYNKGTVNAICTVHFLKKLRDKNKLKDFFQTSVSDRYLIEDKQGEFKDFYNSLDDETKTELLNKSPFKIMVYQDNIDNIVSNQDDFCIISINNIPKLVAYIFTDQKFLNTDTDGIGWISWREVDIKFYDELYRCQLNKNNRIENITTYLN